MTRSLRAALAGAGRGTGFLQVGLAAALFLGPQAAHAEPPPSPDTPSPPTPAIPATPEAAPPVDDEEPPPSTPAELILLQVKEARTFIKAKQFPEGLALLKEAIEQAEKAGLTASEQADLFDYYGNALQRADLNEEALVAFRRAASLAPKDGIIQLDLAQLYDRLNRTEEIIASVKLALKLGLSDEDKLTAEKLLKESRLDFLHDRLEFLGSLSFGYDSNILENQQHQTIAGQSTGGAAARQMRNGRLASQGLCDSRALLLPSVYSGCVASEYQTAIPSPTQYGVPLNLNLDLVGRVVGSSRVGLWLGYRFEQTFMTYAQQQSDATGPIPDKDTYNFQQHTAIVRVSGRPRRWIEYNARAEGFANFSGLSQFSAFQYGVNGIVDLTFIETKEWRTRFSFTNNWRNSFDQVNDGYANGNKDVLLLSQELRKRRFRIKAGYQFSYDKTGVLTALSPLQPTITNPLVNCTAKNDPATCQPIMIGSYTYLAPLSYLGNQLFVSGRLNIPHDIYFKATLRYEYRSYDGLYSATYDATQPVDAITGNPAINETTGKTFLLPAIARVTLPGVQRKDSQISSDISINKDLPYDLAISLGFGSLHNYSTIHNSIDNRDFAKYTLTTTISYGF